MLERREMNNGSGSTSDSPNVVMPLYHIDSRSIRPLLLAETGDEEEVDEAVG